MSDAVIQDKQGNAIDVRSRCVACWEDAPGAMCLVSYCTPETREIELVALNSGDVFAYQEWNGGGVVNKKYRCTRGLDSKSS